MPSVPLEGEAALDDFRPHIKAALQHLEQLGKVLHIAAPPVITQVGGLGLRAVNHVAVGYRMSCRFMHGVHLLIKRRKERHVLHAARGRSCSK